MADLESSNACLLSGDTSKARASADHLLESALATSDPYLQTLAWNQQARVATAESDLRTARESIQRALAIVDSSEIGSGAWQTFATASQVYRDAKELRTAEMYRDRAESCVLQIANSFEPAEPLRATFLAAAPVRQILQGTAAIKSTRPRRLSSSSMPEA